MHIEPVNEVGHRDRTPLSICIKQFLNNKEKSNLAYSLTEFNFMINLAALGMLCVE